MTIKRSFSSHSLLVLSSVTFTLAITSGLCSLAYLTYHQLQVGQQLQRESNRQLQQKIQLSQLEQAQQHRRNNDLASCRKILGDILTINPAYKQLRESIATECYRPLNQALLAEARQYQKQSQYAKAIMIAEQIHEGTEKLAAETLIKQSSQQILRAAEDRYLSSDADGLDDAIRWASTLKQDNPLFNKAQAKIQHWQQEWSTNQKHLRTSRQAKDEGNLLFARQMAQSISPHPFWQEKRNTLLADIHVADARYANIYQQATQSLEDGEIDLGQELVNQLPDYPPWASRKMELQKRINIHSVSSEINSQRTNNWLMPVLYGTMFGFLIGLCSRNS